MMMMMMKMKEDDDAGDGNGDDNNDDNTEWDEEPTKMLVTQRAYCNPQQNLKEQSCVTASAKSAASVNQWQPAASDGRAAPNAKLERVQFWTSQIRQREQREVLWPFGDAAGACYALRLFSHCGTSGYPQHGSVACRLTLPNIWPKYRISLDKLGIAIE